MFLLILMSVFAGAALLIAGFTLNNALTLPDVDKTATPETVAEARSARLVMLVLSGFLFSVGTLLFVVSHLIPA